MSRPSGISKLSNQYQDAAGYWFCHEIPKAVWAAIAISALTQGGDQLAKVRELVLAEWGILHANGIVPQKVTKKAREEAAKYDAKAEGEVM